MTTILPGDNHYPNADLVTDTAIQMIIAESARLDSEQEAAADASFQASVKRNEERAEISRLISSMKRDLEAPNHTKQSRAALESRIKANEAKLERLAKVTKPKIVTPARMPTKTMRAFLAKTTGRPHVLKEVTIPAQYKKLELPAAIALACKNLSAVDEREAAIREALLPREDAKNRMAREVKAKGERSKAIPLAEFAAVRHRSDGAPYTMPINIPTEAFFDAVVPLAIATFEDRLNRFYDSKEFEDGVTFLSLSERRKLLRELKAERDQTEMVLGAMLRSAVVKGHDVIVPPNVSIKNIFPLIVDPNWVKPQQWEERPAGSGGGSVSHNAF